MIFFNSKIIACINKTIMVKRNKESSKNFAKVKKGHSKIHSKSKAKSMNSNNPDRVVPAGGNF